MSLQFQIVSGPDTGRTHTVQPGNDMIVGRGNHAYYRLNDPRVSRSHCQIDIEGDQVTVICLGGSGGTRVNGKAVQKQLLELGDVVQVGDTQLRLQMGDFPLEDAMAAMRTANPEPQKAPDPEKLETLSGTKLGRFDIGPVIGRGTTSMLFCANDTEENRPVALKVLLPEFSKNEEDLQRFIRAMKTMMPLKHPNLVRLHGAGKTGPYCWVAMEYIAGENLKQVIDRTGVVGMLDWKNAFKVAVQVARALAYAHGQQIIHRNVTPTNILRDATTKDVKLGDLMLSKALEGNMAQQITRPGELVGDVAYMSPERTRGMADIDQRSDLYGLGATLYALLTGHAPFEGVNLVEKITKIRQEPPVKPTKYQLAIPHGFEQIVLKLLEKRPEDRYASAEDLLRDLERVGKVQGVSV
jgi:Protein kinase domain/FHA domain